MKIVYYSSKFSTGKYGCHKTKQVLIDKISDEIWEELKAINGYKIWYNHYESLKLRDAGFIFVSYNGQGRKPKCITQK